MAAVRPAVRNHYRPQTSPSTPCTENFSTLCTEFCRYTVL